MSDVLPKGVCPVCRYPVALRLDGTVRQHRPTRAPAVPGVMPSVCTGTHQQPLESADEGCVIRTPDTLKMVREALCAAMAGASYTPALVADPRLGSWMDALHRLIEDIDRQRPLGPDGVHGDRHTRTCGCEDKPTMELRLDADMISTPLFSPGDTLTITDLDGASLRYEVLEPLDSGVRIKPVDPPEDQS